MRTTSTMIRLISILAILSGFATLAILITPIGLVGSELANRAQIGAAVSSAFALILSIMAIIVSARVNSSDFRAEEDVKANTAQLLACLRSILIKSALLSQLSPNDRMNLEFADERRVFSQFLTSTTAFAYWSWVGYKSEIAKEKPEKWRIFFLSLVEILQKRDVDFRQMAKTATDIENLLTGLSKRDIRQIAGYVSDLSQAVGGFKYSRENDVIINAMFSTYGSTDKQDHDRADTIRRKFLYLKQKGIQDPNLDLWLALFADSVEGVRDALGAGADPNLTDSQLLARHQDELKDFSDTLQTQ